MTETKPIPNSVTAALAALEEAINVSTDTLERSKRTSGEQEGDAIKNISTALEALPQGSREVVLDFVQSRYVDDAPQRSTIRLHSKSMLVDTKNLLKVLEATNALLVPFHELVKCLMPFKKLRLKISEAIAETASNGHKRDGNTPLEEVLFPGTLTMQHLFDLVKAGDAAETALTQLGQPPGTKPTP